MAPPAIPSATNRPSMPCIYTSRVVEQAISHMNDLAFRPAWQLADAVRNGELSPGGARAGVPGSHRCTEPDAKCFRGLAARRGARGGCRTAADDRRRETDRALAGLPVGVKDLEDVAGLPTTYGSVPFKDYRPVKDSVQVARLKAAGAIILGKTNTPEFGYTGLTKNRVFGVTRNPWNLERTPGGSSGGSSAAIASGDGAARDRVRRRRLDPHSGVLRRRLRPEADLRSHSRRSIDRGTTDAPVDRHGLLRAAHPHRARRGAFPRRGRRARSVRSRDPARAGSLVPRDARGVPDDAADRGEPRPRLRPRAARRPARGRGGDRRLSPAPGTRSRSSTTSFPTSGRMGARLDGGELRAPRRHGRAASRRVGTRLLRRSPAREDDHARVHRARATEAGRAARVSRRYFRATRSS